jgi:hypothetical protein
MKTKGGSLYEVLKSASRPNGADDGAPTSPEPPATPASEVGQPTLQERLAAYKAAKLAAAAQSPAAPPLAPAPAPEPSRASSATLILEPDPTPIPAPTLTRVAPTPAFLAATPDPASMVEVSPKGPGERVVRLTYNTVLFGGMVAVGLLFIAYAVGLHVGKSNAVAEFQAAVEMPRPAAKPVPAIVQAPAPQPPPPPPKKDYTIRLGEWKFVSAQDRLKALALADDPDLKKALERSGHRSFEKTMIRRGSEERLALYVDRFSDLNSDAAKSALTAMKTFKWKNQTPFAQAAFEEAPPR